MLQTALLKRAKRFERSFEPAALQLTARDLRLLSQLSRHRFLSSRHLALLDRGSEQKLLRRLRTLYDHGLIDRPHAQLAFVPLTGPRPMIYALGGRGQRALSEQGHECGIERDWTERNKRAGAKFIAHTLALADVLVGMEIACRDHGEIKLLDEREILLSAPERTRQSREPLRLSVPGLSNRIGVSSVVPDGLFGLSFPDDTASYFLLEVDRGSMPVTRSRFDRSSFSRKLTVYWEVWKAGRHVQHLGLKQLRVLTVTDTRKRLEHMLDVVREITGGKGSGFFLFATFDELNADSPLEASWTNGRGEPVRLID